MPLRSGGGQIETGAEESEAPSVSWGGNGEWGAPLHLVSGCPWMRAISQVPERGLAVQVLHPLPDNSLSWS